AAAGSSWRSLPWRLRWSCSLDHVRERGLDLAEIPQPGREQEGVDGERDAKARQVELGLAGEQRPAEAVDDPDHRIDRVEQPPGLADQRAAVADGRSVQADLQDE